MRVRTQARRDAIVAEAAKLFEESGYEGASMSELSKRLGGSKATLYRYFPSKESLLVAVVQAVATSHLTEAVHGFTQDTRGVFDLKEALQRFGEKMLAVMNNDRRATAIYRVVIAESGRSPVGQLFYQSGPSECIAAISSVLGEAMDRGELRRADPRVAALQFTSLLTAETEMRIYQQEPPAITHAQIGEMVVRAVEQFLFGASPR